MNIIKCVSIWDLVGPPVLARMRGARWRGLQMVLDDDVVLGQVLDVRRGPAQV